MTKEIILSDYKFFGLIKIKEKKYPFGILKCQKSEISEHTKIDEIFFE
jgi:hypothetical protein